MTTAPSNGRVPRFGSKSEPVLVALSLGLVAAVGLLDYFTGFELNFFAFYLIPVILAVWFVGRGFGAVISSLCAAVSIAGDIVAGARYSSMVVPAWNTGIALTFYFVVVWILARLRSLHDKLEERVWQRTAALRSEMRERMRLEEEILSISEREQRRLGHDLHDSLCQHLTGVAFAGEVLSEELKAKALPEAKSIDHIVTLIEEGIELTRTLARGLQPFELKGEGFTDALRELAGHVTEAFKLPCVFECDRPLPPLEPGLAIHLYRIAQEAVNNAVKHSKATGIILRVEMEAGAMLLTVCDDGIGMSGRRDGNGMGLRIMAYRASVIGAVFAHEPLLPTGTRVSCRMACGKAHEDRNELEGKSSSDR